MGKRNYVRPVATAELFRPNEFVAACPRPDTWVATCDNHASLIFYTENGVLKDLQCDMNRGGCGKTHEFSLVDTGGLKPKANCYILDGVSGNAGNTHSNIATYSDYFTTESYRQYSNNHNDVTYLVLKEEYQYLLKPAYWCWINGGQNVLLTSDLGNIKNPS